MWKRFHFHVFCHLKFFFLMLRMSVTGNNSLMNSQSVIWPIFQFYWYCIENWQFECHCRRFQRIMKNLYSFKLIFNIMSLCKVAQVWRCVKGRLVQVDFWMNLTIKRILATSKAFVTRDILIIYNSSRFCSEEENSGKIFQVHKIFPTWHRYLYFVFVYYFNIKSAFIPIKIYK